MKIPPKGDRWNEPILPKIVAELRHVLESQLHALGTALSIVGRREFPLEPAILPAKLQEWIDDLGFAAGIAPGSIAGDAAGFRELLLAQLNTGRLPPLKTVEQPHSLAKKVNLLGPRQFLFQPFPLGQRGQLELPKIVAALGQLGRQPEGIFVKNGIGIGFGQNGGELGRPLVVAVTGEGGKHLVAVNAPISWRATSAASSSR